MSASVSLPGPDRTLETYHTRGAGRAWPVPEHRGLAAAGRDHLHLGQAGGAQQRRHLPGAGRQMRRRRRIRRHRRDPDQPLQADPHRRQHVRDRRREPLVLQVPGHCLTCA